MNYKAFGAFLIVLLVVVFAVAIISSDSGSSSYSSSSSSSSKIECRSCDREFSSSSANGKSIRRTGMCENCYNNFKSMQQALGNW